MPRYAFRAPGRLAALVLVLVAVAGPASAHRMHLKDMISESSIQRTTVWTISAEIMRLALNVDEPGSMVRLREAHEQFGQSLVILRQGVSELQDRGDVDTDLMVVDLSQAGRQWAALDEALGPVWGAGTISPAKSRELIDLSRDLGRSIDQVHMHFHRAANHYGVVTVIGMAVMTTERSRSLGQRIAADFMAVALNSNTQDRTALGETVNQLDGLLRALQHGDPTLGLIPPPTVELRQKMSEIDAIWQQMVPHLSAAISGEPLGRAPIEGLSALSRRLHAELGAANDILAGLMPAGRG